VTISCRIRSETFKFRVPIFDAYFSDSSQRRRPSCSGCLRLAPSSRQNLLVIWLPDTVGVRGVGWSRQCDRCTHAMPRSYACGDANCCRGDVDGRNSPVASCLHLEKVATLARRARDADKCPPYAGARRYEGPGSAALVAKSRSTQTFIQDG
jgi:hypothetical protein